MSDDIEKNRVEYVQKMEQTVEHLKREYDRYKAIADKWEPVITTEVDTQKQSVKVGLRFGGKNVHCTLTYQAMQQHTTEDAITSVTDALVESLVVEQIRKAVAPELTKLVAGAKAVAGAGKW